MSKGLAIIFHSGAYDRVNHGLSIALTNLIIGKDTKSFFTHSSLKYLVKEKEDVIEFIEGDEYYKERFKKFLSEKNIHSIRELIRDYKKLGGKIYVCPASMALLNITRAELIAEVDATMGLASFLSEAENCSLLFI